MHLIGINPEQRWTSLTQNLSLTDLEILETVHFEDPLNFPKAGTLQNDAKEKRLVLLNFDYVYVNFVLQNRPKLYKILVKLSFPSANFVFAIMDPRSAIFLTVFA